LFAHVEVAAFDFTLCAFDLTGQQAVFDGNAAFRCQAVEDGGGTVGFDAITVALLGRNKTWGTFGAGLLFGAFKAGGYTMQAKGVPIDMILILQSVIVLLIAAPALVRWLFRLPDVRALAAQTRKGNADEHK